MLRRIPRAELAESAAPTVRSLLVAEALDVQRELESARASAASLRDLRREFRERLERTLPELVQRLHLPLEPLQTWLELELARFEHARKLRICLNPEDAQKLDETDTFQALLDPLGAIEFVRDASITPGGCVLVSERGTVDARIESRLALVVALLCSQAEAP